MPQDNTAALFPTMASLAQSGAARPVAFVGNQSAFDGVHVPKVISRLRHPLKPYAFVKDPDAPQSNMQKLMQEKMQEAQARMDAMPSFASGVSTDKDQTVSHSMSRAMRHQLGVDMPHGPTLAAFQTLAALGTVPPTVSEISHEALAEAGLHPKTFLDAYTAELAQTQYVASPVPGIDETIRNVSILSGKACAQVMEQRYVPTHADFGTNNSHNGFTM